MGFDAVRNGVMACLGSTNIPGDALSITTVAGQHSTDVPGHGGKEDPDPGRGERYPLG